MKSAKAIPLKQVAALPLMVDGLGGVRVMLITSRETKQWVIPKGWPMKGLKDWEAAAIEARQEAGLVGKVKRKPLGSYSYFKRFPDRFELVQVTVYPLWVQRELDDWAERCERQSFWLAPRIAADLVQETDLAELIRPMAEIGSGVLAI
ncbi:NUDIX hydrolase [Lichenifustis flavocetrariae]|uniref:NUDIX hydrolase n=1 Tax=Lichenifustis flavocetrariae TaxID=2949735 RepID=A0AA42CGT3_9HYPH|nr:NUDIX hydrolase [Lichenifustis flavocetrariae]MCW6506888.1 NUDIX hydrolase [Lichenifustis flavocetrariae]